MSQQSEIETAVEPVTRPSSAIHAPTTTETLEQSQAQNSARASVSTQSVASNLLALALENNKNASQALVNVPSSLTVDPSLSSSLINVISSSTSQPLQLHGHSSSKRVIQHLAKVRQAVLVQVHGRKSTTEEDDEEEDEEDEPDPIKRLKREDAKLRAVAKNPMLTLPGRQMMVKHEQFTSGSKWSQEDATSAALLSVALPKRKKGKAMNDSSAGAAAMAVSRAAKREPPSVETILTRQEWVQAILAERWRQVKEEVDKRQQELNCMAPNETGTPAASPMHSCVPSPTASKSRRPSFTNSSNPSITTAAATSSSASSKSLTSASTSSTAHSQPPSHSRLGSVSMNRPGTHGRQASMASMLTKHHDTDEKQQQTSTGLGLGGINPSSTPSASDVLHGSDDYELWEDFGAGSPEYQAWYRNEIKSLSSTAYDEYVTAYHQALEVEKDRLINGPKSLHQYAPPSSSSSISLSSTSAASAGSASSSSSSSPFPPKSNPFHARAFAIHTEWRQKYPPILQPRYHESTSITGTDASKKLTAAATTKHNPVLVPVIERKLMDLSKPLHEMMKQIEREERGGGSSSISNEASSSSSSSSVSADDKSLVIFDPTAPSTISQPISPRTEYNQKRSLTLDNLVALLMKLDEPALQAIRAEFESQGGDGLLIYDFVLMACTHISSCSAGPEDLQSLVEMFREIDVNGDAVMSFEEFSSFLSMLATTYGHEATQNDQLPHFVPVTQASHEDNELHSRPCEIVKWCGGSGLSGVPGLNKILLIERNSRLLKVYNTELTCVQTIRCRAPILAVEYLPPRHQVVVSCSDRTLQFFSCKKSTVNWTLECTWQLQTSQTCLEYAGKNVFTVDGLANQTNKPAWKNSQHNIASGNNADGKKGASGNNTGGKNGSSSPSSNGVGPEDDELGGSSTQLNFTILYTADTNGRITCWNLDRGEEKFRINHAHSDVIMEMKLLTTLSNSMLVTAGLDSLVKVFDCNKGLALHTLSGHTKAPLHIAFHPDLKLLVTGGLDRFALVWPNPKSSTGASLPVMRLSISSPMSHIIGIEVLLGSPEIVIGDSSGGFSVFDLRNGSCIQSFQASRTMMRAMSHADSTGIGTGGGTTMNSLCVIPQQGLLVAAGPKLFSFKRTTGVLGTRADDEPVKLCVWDPYAMVFLTAAETNLKVWNGLTGALMREEKRFITAASAREPIPGTTVGPTITAMISDDRYRRAYVGLSNGIILALNVNSGAVMSKISVGHAEVSSLVYHSSTKQIISGSWDGNVCWIDDLLETISRKTHRDQTKDIIAVASAPEYKLVASLSADSTVCLYDDRSGPLIMKWSLPAPPTAMTFLSPYPFLVIADQNGGFTFFDIQTPFSKSYLFHIPELNLLPLSRPSSPRARARADERSAALQRQRDDEDMMRMEDEAEAEVEVEKQRMDALTLQPPHLRGLSRPTSANKPRSGSSSVFPSARSKRGEEEPATVSAPLPGRKYPAIVSLKFEPIHRYLLITDETGYVKVYPLGYVLLRKFHPTEVANPSSPFMARIFKPLPSVSSSSSSSPCIIIRNGWTLSVTAAQPRIVEKVDQSGTGSKKNQSTTMAEKLSHLYMPIMATRVVGTGHGGSRREGANSLQSSALPSGSRTPMPVGSTIASSVTLSAPISNNGSSQSSASSSSPNEPSVTYAPASLIYPPVPTRASFSPDVIKSWTVQDTNYVKSHLQPSIQIQAHQDSVEGCDLLLDTLYEPTLVTWSFDGCVRLWNLATGERVGSLMQGHNTRTSQRDEKWHFYFDLSKHRASEAEFYQHAFKRPPSPVISENEDDADEENETNHIRARSLAQHQPRAQIRSATNSQRHTISGEEKIDAMTRALVIRKSSDGQTHTNEDDDGSDSKDSHSHATNDTATATATDDADEDLRSVAVKKGDTFLTDLDGTRSPESSIKKRKKNNTVKSSPSSSSVAVTPLARRKKKKSLNITPSPSAATDAAALLSKRSSLKTNEHDGRLSTNASAATLRDHVYSTHNTPIPSTSTSQTRHGMIHSYSQPVLPMTNMNHVTAPKAVTFSNIHPLPSSRPPSSSPPKLSPSSSSSLLASAPSMNSTSTFLTPSQSLSPSQSPPPSSVLLSIPRRSSPWKSMAGANALSKDLSSFAPPPKQIERGTAVRQVDKYLSPIKSLALMTSSPSTPSIGTPPLNPTPATASSALLSFSPSSSTTPAGSPSLSSGGMFRSSPPMHASVSSPVFPRPTLLRLESKTLPSPNQYRGRPRLGRRKKHTRINSDGDEETDSEAERAEEEREEEERRAKSWWQPTNPRHIRTPSTLKKPTTSEDEGDDGTNLPKQLHTLYIDNRQLPLTSKQAATVASLTAKVASAESIIASDRDDSMSVVKLEKRHRAHAEAMSEYYNFNQ